MKKTTLAAILIALIFLLMTAMAEDWRADLTKLLNPEEIPATTTIRYDVHTPEGAQVQEKRHAVELVSSRGDVLNVEAVFNLVNLPLTDDQWQEVQSWFKSLVMDSVQAIGADSESLASVVAQAVVDARKAAQAQGSLAVWANNNLMIKTLSATVPYYPTLQKGDSGATTQRLQKRLIELGFLDDVADGHFGSKTEEAVKLLEKYVRRLEQELIDQRPATAQLPALTVAPEEYAESYLVPLSITAPTGEPEQTPEPAEPTVVPGPTPATQVDGIADPLLQAYLFSDHFRLSLGTLSSTASGDQVQRVQRRLQNLGYLAGTLDGYMGAETARALRIFQHYNNLSESGQADDPTLQLLYSENAAKPANAMLVEGMSGEEVSRLQKRLRVLGFAAISVDGSFGASTKAGVENLQKYMQLLEAQSIQSYTGVKPNAGDLSYVVNGAADSMLLEEFYADTFPAIPATLSTGSSGPDVVRVQRRLQMLGYYKGTLDGKFGGGTVKAIEYFQRLHRLGMTGVADRPTLLQLFDESAQEYINPYVLIVSVSEQRVYAYGLDENNAYTVLERTMVCSTGKNASPTPAGTYKESTGPGARWHFFKKFNCWAQYAYYIKGDIMFHSVLFGSKDGNATSSSVNNLGNKASHGCVRLSVEDAKWIWENCPAQTTVIVN